MMKSDILVQNAFNDALKGTVNDQGSDFSKFYFFALWLDKVLKLKLPNQFSPNH